MASMSLCFKKLPMKLIVGAAIASQSACGWLGQSEAPPLPGERISVLELERTLEPDPRIADLKVRLPAPYVNRHWPQAGGYAGHAMHHLSLAEAPKVVWKADIGAAADDETRILVSPIVAGGVVYTMDAMSQVSAFDASDGRLFWRVSLQPEEEEPGEFGGGLAYRGTQLFAATGYGDVFSLDPKTGAQVWRAGLGRPIRSEPTVSAKSIYVITYDNQLYSLNADDGTTQWNHVGIAEVAGLIGAANAAAESDVVVAPYSSGELFAFRSDNGRVLWNDSLIRRRGSTGLSELSDINGRPVIDRGRVYAVSHGGRMVAIDIRTGERIWDQNIAGVQSPWIAGDFLFVLTTANDLVCLSRREGRIRWVRPLPRYGDEEEREDPIQWLGPVLAGDRLILVSSDARAIAISPYTGKMMSELDLPSGATVGPVVADDTLYVLTKDAQLTAWR